MGRYLVKRLLIGAATLLALATVTFFLIHAIPGSPFSDGDSNLPANTQAELTQHYGLDRSLLTQYFKFLGNAVRGDFGSSLYRRGRSVGDIIATGLPSTAKLGAVAFCIALIVGVLLGTVAVLSKNHWVKGAAAVFGTVGVSVPGFLLALLMMTLFGAMLHWLPTVGLSTWRHYIMPAAALALPPIAMIARLTKTSLTEVMQQDYILLAKSKGTAPAQLIMRHALKNALLPVVTYAGPLLASLLTGSFVIETLFSIPGIGAEFVTSVSNRDYTMIMGLIIFYGAVIIICNIVTDLLSAYLDPRIRLN